MNRYAGTLLSMKHLFLQYVSLTDKTVIYALFAGLLSTLVSLAMLFRRPTWRRAAVLLIITLLPMFFGIIGTVNTILSTKEARSLERRVGIEPSDKKYYNWEYGYAQIARYFFPAIIGGLSARPSFAVLMLVSKRMHGSHDMKAWKNKKG